MPTADIAEITSDPISPQRKVWDSGRTANAAAPKVENNRANQRCLIESGDILPSAQLHASHRLKKACGPKRMGPRRT